MKDGLVAGIHLDKNQDSIFSCATDFLSGAGLSFSVISGLILISRVSSTDYCIPLIHMGILWINTLNAYVVLRCYGEKKRKVIENIQ